MSAPVIQLANIRIPNTTEVLEAASMAAAKHLLLVTNGRETLLSPHVPPGWTRVVTRTKPTPRSQETAHA